MDYDIEKIFLPSVGVELVLDINSLTPISRSTIIYDVDFARQLIVIAQPLVPLTKKTAFKQLHLTTIVQTVQKKVRTGIQCIPIKFIADYKLANRASVRALILRYELPISETNIRSAFRLPLSTKHTIKANLVYKQIEYHTQQDFNIRDISLAGIGILINRKNKGGTNPLTELQLNDVLAVGIILIDKAKEKPVGTIDLITQVIRININYSRTHILTGLKTIKMSMENETMLNQFIHNAQIDELNRFRIKNL